MRFMGKMVVIFQNIEDAILIRSSDLLSRSIIHFMNPTPPFDIENEEIIKRMRDDSILAYKSLSTNTLTYDIFESVPRETKTLTKRVWIKTSALHRLVREKSTASVDFFLIDHGTHTMWNTDEDCKRGCSFRIDSVPVQYVAEPKPSKFDKTHLFVRRYHEGSRIERMWWVHQGIGIHNRQE